MRKYLMTICLLIVATACDELHEERLRGLGLRVEALEQQALDFNNQITSLQAIVRTIQEHGVITGIDERNDGSFAMTMSNGQIACFSVHDFGCNLPFFG